MVDQLIFTTNLGNKYGPFGGVGGRPFTIEDVQVVGFTGRSDPYGYMDKFGVLTITKNKEYKNWTTGGTEDIVAEQLYGITPIDDGTTLPTTLRGPIERITVYSGGPKEAIWGMTVYYKGGKESNNLSGRGGKPYDFVLEPDEWINQVEYHNYQNGHEWVQGLRFGTNKRTSDVMGWGDSNTAWKCIKKEKHVLTSFMYQVIQGQGLKALGVTFTDNSVISKF
jgi:hypothetical protein